MTLTDTKPKKRQMLVLSTVDSPLIDKTLRNAALIEKRKINSLGVECLEIGLRLKGYLQ